MRHIIVFLFFAGAVCAQPVINPGGVANFVSLAPDGLNNSGLAQGSIFVVNGTGLGAPNATPANLFQNTVYPLPTSGGLNGTTVQILGSETVYAVMLYESPTMVAAIVPSSTPTGPVSITVTYNGQTSNAINVHVVANAFGIMNLAEFDGLPSAGTGPALIEIVNPDGSLSPNGLGNSAMPGQTVLLYGTGLGAANGDESQGPTQAAGSFTFEVLVGNQAVPYNPATDAFGRLLGNGFSAAGVDFFEFQVPSGVQGCYVSVAVVSQGVTSNLTTMAINPNGGLCSDSAFGYSSADFQQFNADSASRIGEVVMTSLNLVAPDGSTQRQDQATGSFTSPTAQQLTTAPGMLASAGSCFVSTFSGTNPPNFTPPGTSMDAGPGLNLNGPDGYQQIAESMNPFAYNFTFNAPFLDPGAYTVDNGGGGASVGAFQGTINVPAAPQWLDAQTISSVGENSNLRITWSGGDPAGLVHITGVSIDTNLIVGAVFDCAANSTDGQFTVPSYVLSWMPDSGASVGVMTVSAAGQTRFQAPGLEVGYLQYDIGVGQVVQFTPIAQLF